MHTARNVIEIPASAARLFERLSAVGRGAPADGPRNEKPAPTIEGTTATIRLYDPIDSWGDWWGLSAKEFVDALDELPAEVDTIELLINSPGGMVYDAIAIMNALRRHRAKVVAVVEGLAASAASYIAVSADELVMAPNSELMIHDAWNGIVGNAEDMREMAAFLDRVSDNIASIYAEKAGGTVAEWRDAMRRETWYSAQEAVAAGLADRVAGLDSSASASFDLSIFRYPGRAAAPAPAIPSSSTDSGEHDESTASDPGPGDDDTTPPASDTAAGDELADDTETDSPSTAVDDVALGHARDALELLNI